MGLFHELEMFLGEWQLIMMVLPSIYDYSNRVNDGRPF